MTGRDFLTLAGQLVVVGAPGIAEARYRTAVSRAYYGAFHLVVEFLAEFNVTVKKNHLGHEDASRRLFQTGHPIAMEAARNLDELRGYRNDADYRFHVRGFDNRNNAQDRCEMAATVRLCLDRCRVEPERTLFQAALDSARS